MLIPRWQQDAALRLQMLLRDIVAQDEETATELVSSRGRSKAGRGRWYVLLSPGYGSAEYGSRLHYKFRAKNDEDAYQHALNYLEKEESKS